MADAIATRVCGILCFLILSGAVELFIKSNHKLTRRLFSILDGRRTAFAGIA